MDEKQIELIEKILRELQDIKVILQEKTGEEDKIQK